MDPARFYGTRHKNICVRPIPQDSSDSELSSEEDEHLESYNAADDPSDGEMESDDDPDGPSTSTADGPSTSTAAGCPIWRQRDPEHVHLQTLNFEGAASPIPPAAKEPITYFRDFIDDDLLLYITEQSNLYAAQTNINKHLSLSKGELEQFISILFQMSMVKMPRARMYWSQECRYPPVADTMTVNRFEEIKRFFHCNNNDAQPQPCPDKLYKVRPVIDNLTTKFRALVPKEMLSVDEQVIPFKGKSCLKTYNPKKPKKWGYKVYVLSGEDGLIHNMEFYTGKIMPVDVVCICVSHQQAIASKTSTNNSL